MQCYMEKTVVKKEAGATGQQFAELLCDFMFKRVFGSEANKDLLIPYSQTCFCWLKSIILHPMN